MFCAKCGNSLKDGENFCNNCGNKVENNLFSNDEGLYNKEENITNTLKVFMNLTIAIIILLTVSFALRSTPEKTVKKYAKAMENNDIKKALSYTNYKTVLKNERGYTDLEVEKEIREQEQYFKTYQQNNMEIKIDNIKEIVKGKNMAKFTADETFMYEGDIESESFSFILFKEKGKWIIDIDASEECTTEECEDYDDYDDWN